MLMMMSRVLQVSERELKRHKAGPIWCARTVDAVVFRLQPTGGRARSGHMRNQNVCAGYAYGPAQSWAQMRVAAAPAGRPDGRLLIALAHSAAQERAHSESAQSESLLASCVSWTMGGRLPLWPCDFRTRRSSFTHTQRLITFSRPANTHIQRASLLSLAQPTQ